MSLLDDPRWGEALSHLPDYLGNHVRVSLAALALGLIISLPLAILTRNRPAPRAILLALASIVQTVPGLALLALFYPLLLLAASVTLKWFGVSFSAFGFLPAMLALALYSMLPVLRNGITGLNGIDPALIEAAKGVGMTSRQSLVMVELPLALPVIMAGIRTAAVWVIGTATLSTPIGQTSLGNYIFAGLQTQNWVFVLFGCFASALLALAVDQLLGLIESGLRQRRRLRAGLGAIGIAAVVAATLVPAKMGAVSVSAVGVVAMLLASIGLYGVIAYSVARRTREIGIRMAIGASPRDVLRLVMGKGLTLVAIGAAIGVVLGFGIERMMNSMFNIGGVDITVYLVVVPCMIAATMLAAYALARRAARIPPTQALRYE